MDDMPAAATRLFVVGSFVVACCAKLARLPRPGETLNAAAFTVEPGGKGFNLAVAARRLGADVGGVFGIGHDLFADLAERAFECADLSLTMLTRHETATGCGIGFTDMAGENCIAVHAGANARISRGDVEHRRATIGMSDMIMGQFEAPDEAIRAAFAIGRDGGRATLLNPSPCRDLDPGLLALTTILVVNRQEARSIAEQVGLWPTAAQAGADGAPDHAALARYLIARGPDLVVVTLGAEGAVAFARDRPPAYQPAFRVDVQDTIGCGDAFTAGLAIALVEKRPLPECLARACACGAIVAERFGVFDALPVPAELDAMLGRPHAPACEHWTGPERPSEDAPRP